MSITIDLPPAIMQEAEVYAQSQKIAVETFLVDCLDEGLKRLRAAGGWRARFDQLVRETSLRREAPYHFSRADAYAEAMR